MRRHLSLFLCLVAAACGSPQRANVVAFDGAEGDGTPAQRVARGHRLATVLGCTDCHGPNLQGAQFEPQMKQYGPIYASNLSRLVPGYSDAQIDAIVRRGTHPTRGSVWVMPSHIFQHLSAADLAAVIAFLRSVPPTGQPTPPPQFSALDRREIAAGKYKPEAKFVRETAAKRAPDLGPAHALGRYIAEVTCAECHRSTLTGEPGHPPGSPPDLVVAGAYSRDEFERLITQGVATGNRTLNPMMAGVATGRFSQLTSHERDALYAYLRARAEQQR
jgi:mono/diheme cytochrome c family protein